MLRNNYVTVPEGHYRRINDDVVPEYKLNDNTKDDLRDRIINEGFAVEDDGVVDEYGATGIFRLMKNQQPIGRIATRTVMRQFYPDGRPINRFAVFEVIHSRYVFELVVKVENVNYRDTLLQIIREVVGEERPVGGARMKRHRKTKKRTIRKTKKRNTRNHRMKNTKRHSK
jgi:hypothetical protein